MAVEVTIDVRLEEPRYASSGKQNPSSWNQANRALRSRECMLYHLVGIFLHPSCWWYCSLRLLINKYLYTTPLRIYCYRLRQSIEIATIKDKYYRRSREKL